MYNLLKLLLLILTLPCINCNSSKPILFSPYYENCLVAGGGLDTIIPKIPDYVVNGISKLDREKSEYEIVYYYNFINGDKGDGVKVCLIDDGVIQLHQLTYTFLENRNGKFLIDVEPKNISKKGKIIVQKVLKDLSEYS